jgi:4-hydroxybenzoate polyprenyltransferase
LRPRPRTVPYCILSPSPYSDRPLASGQLSTTQGLLFLSGQLTCGLGILLTFDPSCVLLGIASMPLVVVYPLCKRFTNWPQLVLGLAFNWGALMGWPAVAAMKPSFFDVMMQSNSTSDLLQNATHIAMTTSISELGVVHTLPLYAAGVCWTLVYDTLYGYQDRKDDRKLGLKSTSLHLGDRPQLALTAIGSGMVGGLALSGYSVGLSAPFYAGVLAVGGHLMWQIWTADLNDPKNLWQRFNANKYTGGAVTAAIIAGHF